MKFSYKASVAFFILLLVGILFFNASWRTDFNTRRTISDSNSAPKNQKDQNQDNAVQQDSADKQLTDWLAKQAEETKKIEEMFASWARYPIEFYGKVVDENDQPVPDAVAHFLVSDTSENGTTNYKRQSDKNGLFYFSARGPGMSVRVVKKGYYSYQKYGRGFEYAGPGNDYRPNPQKPEIFRLRKKGVEEPLIHENTKFEFPINGEEQSISLFKNLMQAGRLDEADLVISFRSTGRKSDFTQDWSLKFDVPSGGGIVESDEEFMFLAPAAGYQTSLELRDQYEFNVQRKFYVKLPDNKGYARIDMDIYGQCGVIRMDYFINPTSRNLEYDQGWPIQVKWRRDDSVELVYPTPEEQHLADEREARQEKADASKP